MDIIRSRVPFFHMFSNRNYQVICPQQDNRVYDTNELNTLLFRDSNLKDGNELLLKEPEKSPTATRKYQEEDNSDDNNEGEGEEPQSEDPENDEISLDSEERAIQEAEANLLAQGVGAEQGEDELEEIEEEQNEDDDQREEPDDGQIYQAGS